MRIDKEEVVRMFGEEMVEKVASSELDLTSRVMYPSFEDPSHLDRDEWVGETFEVNGYNVTAYYYTKEDEDVCDVEPEFEIDEPFPY